MRHLISMIDCRKKLQNPLKTGLNELHLEKIFCIICYPHQKSLRKYHNLNLFFKLDNGS